MNKPYTCIFCRENYDSPEPAVFLTSSTRLFKAGSVIEMCDDCCGDDELYDYSAMTRTLKKTHDEIKDYLMNNRIKHNCVKCKNEFESYVPALFMNNKCIEMCDDCYPIKYGEKQPGERPVLLREIEYEAFKKENKMQEEHKCTNCKIILTITDMINSPGGLCKTCNTQSENQDSSSENPLDKQVGGDHYKNFKIQPMKFIHKNGLSHAQGNVIKYIVRYKFKNKKQDLEKAKHCIDLLIELEYGDEKN